MWDYNDGIGRENNIQQPKNVTPDVVQETKEKEMRPFGDPLANLKNLVAEQIQNRKGLITMPIPAGHKTYKRKTGDPKEKYTPKREYMEMKEMTCGQEESHIQVMKLIYLTCFVQNVREIIYPCFAQ